MERGCSGEEHRESPSVQMVLLPHPHRPFSTLHHRCGSSLARLAEKQSAARHLIPTCCNFRAHLSRIPLTRWTFYVRSREHTPIGLGLRLQKKNFADILCTTGVNGRTRFFYKSWRNESVSTLQLLVK